MTLEDIARLANVSKSTVSRVINNKREGVGEETRERVKAIIREYNFTFSSSEQRKTRTIGVIVPDLYNDFFITLISEIEHAAEKYNYSVIICHTESNFKKEEKAISTLFLMHVDGVILTSTVNEAVDIHRRFLKYNVPYILLDRNVRNIGNSINITVDNEYAIFRVAEYFIKNGHKQILYISGPASVSTSIERLNGFVMALKHYGVPFNKEFVKYGDYTFQSGIDIIRQVHEEKQQFDAVISANDDMAIGAIKMLKQLGYIIPDDVQVFGFDNTRSSQVVEPTLSTVAQPVKEMGQKAVELLLAQVNNAPINDKWIRLDHNIIFRESTK